MNERQFALALSLILHLTLLFVLAYVQIHRLLPQDTLFEILVPPIPEKTREPEVPAETLRPARRDTPPKTAESPVPVPPERQEPAPGEQRNREIPEESAVSVLTAEDSLKAFLGKMEAYFRGQWIIPLRGKPAQFLDFDRGALLAPRDSAEALQRFLETRLAEMALSPDEMKKIYPEDDIVEDKMKKDQGIMPALPGVPVGLLAKAAIELARKAIGFFRNPEDVKTVLLGLSEEQVFILHIMWIIGPSGMPEIYSVFPPRFPVSADELDGLLESWTGSRLILREQRGNKTMYYPALPRSEVLQFYLARLAVLHWENNPSAESAEMRHSAIRKIAILNNISLSEYAVPEK